VSLLELGEVVSESEVGRGCESSRLTNSSTKEFSKMLGLLDKSCWTDEDAARRKEKEERGKVSWGRRDAREAIGARESEG